MPFNISLNITGFAELANQMNVRGQAVEQAKNAAVDKLAQALLQHTQQNIGGGHPDLPNSLTGTLRSSFTWRHVRDGVSQVYTMLDYSYWVEFGHTQQPGRYVPQINARLVNAFVPAYPYFRPAIDELYASGEAERIITETLQAAVLNGNGGGGSGGFADVVAPEEVSGVIEL